MERLCGHIHNVVYDDPETGFAVVQVIPESGTAPEAVVGPLHGLRHGEFLEMDGEWLDHPRYGPQFRVAGYRFRVPVTEEGIRRYLGSGLIKGIGPEMARRIVERFGRETLEVIDRDPGRLADVSGIGAKRVATIGGAWREQRAQREAMLFFQAHGLGTGEILRIFRHYGERSVAAVKSDPYRLAGEIRGVGFLTADRIARRLEVPSTSPARIDAGLLYALDRRSEAGHVFTPEPLLLNRASELLELAPADVAPGVGRLASRGRIVVEADGAPRRVYAGDLHRCETSVSERILGLLGSPSGLPRVDAGRALEWVEGRLGFRLARRQRDALRTALSARAMVLTGGPGTGKTTIINALLLIAGAKKVVFRLAAPTGRAAKRMTEATGRPAATLHRLLEFNPRTGEFQRNAARPLDCGLLIVDEASMMDTVMAARLMEAVPPRAGVVFVGDVHQLPSVGPGNVLGDLIDSGVLPVVELEEIFRQARESQIVVNAHRINRGKMPTFGGGDTDCFFVEREDPDAVAEIIVRLVVERLPRRGFDPLRDVQVLTPMHRGPAGARNLNRRLQEALNPPGPVGEAACGPFRVGDKVMQTRNDYGKDVYNGDIGRVSAVEADRREVRVEVDGREIAYEAGDLDELVLAYAVSIHKSQGSEFPAVVFPVLTQHFVLLQRNLIYTALTRAKRMAVIVGTPKALAIGIRNVKGNDRDTGLRERLAAGRLQPVRGA